MNARTNLPTPRRVALLGVAAFLVASSVAFSKLGEAKKEPRFTPVKLEVNDDPIQRDGRFTTSFSPVVKKVAPSVVKVFTTTKPKRVSGPSMPGWPFDDPMFRRFFGDPFGGQSPQFRTPRQHGLGSGVIVSEDGYILTNSHVVENADEVKVALTSGEEYDAKVVGTDPKTDIAVLKIDVKDLPHATLGDSEKIEVGDLVLAVGNPFGIGQTVTMGMISATGRGAIGLDYEDFIQTDAAINPGNSGGALVDAEGRLIGINTAILSRTGGNHGIGFAVPINLARSVMESLVKEGRVVRGFMGVNIQDLTPTLAQEFNVDETHGALVAEVTPRSPAEKAGLKSGDVIVEFNGKSVRDSRTLKLQVAQTPPGEKVPVKVLREGRTKTLEVVLKEFPSDQALAKSRSNDRDAEEQLKGVTVTDIDPAARRQFGLPRELQGALVTQVKPDSAAFEAGLREGDVITEINRRPVTSAEEALELSEQAKGDRFLLRVWSRGGNRYVVVDESNKAG
ncbi:MAG: DegQ family serine endoprotease [Verrucomicrobiota bacterium]